MITVYNLKPAFQKILRPIVIQLAGWGVSANQVTLFALALSIVYGLLLSVWPNSSVLLLGLPIVLLLRMALNAIDGLLAREHGMQSNLGAILNELCDVISDTALYLPLALNTRVASSVLVCLVCLGIISELAGTLHIHSSNTRRYDGPMGKSDRAFGFGLIALLMGFDFIADRGVLIFLLSMLALAGITILRRARRALLQVKEQA